MTMTGMMANALRKNTTCPSGTVSPTYRTNADITANSNTETSLLEMARRKFIEQCCLGRGRETALPRCESDLASYWHGAWHDGRQAAIADPQRCPYVNARILCRRSCAVAESWARCAATLTAKPRCSRSSRRTRRLPRRRRQAAYRRHIDMALHVSGIASRLARWSSNSHFGGEREGATD